MNAVARAITIVGGPTPASFACRVSTAALYKWRKLGRVLDAHAAVLLSRATEAAGELVTVGELAGVDILANPRPTGTDGTAATTGAAVRAKASRGRAAGDGAVAAVLAVDEPKRLYGTVRARKDPGLTGTCNQSSAVTIVVTPVTRAA